MPTLQFVRLLDEKIGHGLVAQQGNQLKYNLRVYLENNDEFPINDLNEDVRKNIRKYHPDILTRTNGYDFINFHTRLGKNDALTGVRYSLYGMKEGGYRKVRVSPHFAYGKKGIPGRIPPYSILTFEIWLRKVTKENLN